MIDPQTPHLLSWCGFWKCRVTTLCFLWRDKESWWEFFFFSEPKYPPGNSHISDPLVKLLLKMIVNDCPFPQVGYVSSPEGRCPILWTCFDCIELLELDLLKVIVYVLPWASNAKSLFREQCLLTYCNSLLSKSDWCVLRASLMNTKNATLTNRQWPSYEFPNRVSHTFVFLKAFLQSIACLKRSFEYVWVVFLGMKDIYIYNIYIYIYWYCWWKKSCTTWDV